MNKINHSSKNLYFDTYMYIIICLLIYSFFGILFSIYQIDYFRIPQLVFIFIFLNLIWNFIKFFFNYSLKNNIFSIFIIWQFFIIIRINNFNIDEIRLILFEPTHFLSYLTPFVVFLPISSIFSHKKILILLFFSLFFILLHFFVIYNYPVNNLSDLIIMSSLAPVGILLLLSKYLNKYLLFSTIIIILLIIFIALFYGRRSILISSILYIIFSLFINLLKNNKLNSSFKFIIILFISLISFYSIYLFIENSDNSSFQIFNRINIDSRSDVFEAFFKDFKIQDYFIGRGIDGGYFQTINYYNFTDTDFHQVTYRTNIENGFLYMIMKGGIIYLILFLLILFNAIYLGFFKSNNFMVKSFSSYLLIYFIDMFSYGQPTFVFKYFLVWICISFCYSQRIRILNDNQIIKFLNTDKLILNSTIRN
jgi:hypothetical protein